MNGKTVGITGSSGFIGSHIKNYLNLKEHIRVVECPRSAFNDTTELDRFVSGCDVIIHLAAINRHEDPQVIYDTNINLVRKLIKACESTKVTPWIMISSSTQEENDTLYGASKKEGRQLLETWARKNNAKTTGIVIPNVFGPFGKPFYNSVVATFCHQIINEEKPTIINDGILKLIYVNELVETFYNVIKKNITNKFVVDHTYEIRVSSLLDKLNMFNQLYIKEGKLPDLSTSFDLALFNSFRCYIPHNYFPQKLIKHTDTRGSFVEVVRSETSGQFSFSTTKPGITRGNHFHTRKAERFAVIKGKASIQLRKIDSNKVIEYIIDGEEPAYVDIPIWYTHNITNLGEEDLIALFWINEPYSQEDPDTYFVNV